MRDHLPTARGSERDPWLLIEMRHLAALTAVARESSFIDAADTLGYVPSAISQQITYLERVVQRRLVDRSGRRGSVTLTEAGAVLLAHSDEILDQLRRADAELQALTQRRHEALRVGMAHLFGNWLPTLVVRALVADTGGESLARLERATPAELLDAVADGRLDAAFVELPIARGPFFAVEALREPCLLVAPRTGGPGEQDLDVLLHRWPLVRVRDCRATRTLQARQGAAVQTAAAQYAVDNPAAALAFVRAGAAAAVVTARDLGSADGSLVRVPLPGAPERVVGLAWRRDRDDCPAIRALRERMAALGARADKLAPR